MRVVCFICVYFPSLYCVSCNTTFCFQANGVAVAKTWWASTHNQTVSWHFLKVYSQNDLFLVFQNTCSYPATWLGLQSVRHCKWSLLTALSFSVAAVVFPSEVQVCPSDHRETHVCSFWLLCTHRCFGPTSPPSIWHW